ncbi:hypothetical protein [Tautonia plasticadhaerens]|uniref:HEAT repeat protein n=1 Tax=Tautonia plasticadhaerens TaxID=2527974 RepID=A0A518H972_9BACT|nr:hypothetical protein [Tautonia plasticadhaerens]QDV37394.1 hypothetical protein ElP_53330 [Tautonia plasticadhaerens]
MPGSARGAQVVNVQAALASQLGQLRFRITNPDFEGFGFELGPQPLQQLPSNEAENRALTILLQLVDLDAIGEELAEELDQWLANEVQELRYAAAISRVLLTCRGSDGPEDVEAIWALARDGRREVREAMAHGLRAVDPRFTERAVGVLLDLAALDNAGGEFVVRREAILSLARIGGARLDRSIALLRGYLSSRNFIDFQQWFAAIEALVVLAEGHPEDAFPAI